MSEANLGGATERERLWQRFFMELLAIMRRPDVEDDAQDRKWNMAALARSLRRLLHDNGRLKTKLVCGSVPESIAHCGAVELGSGCPESRQTISEI